MCNLVTLARYDLKIFFQKKVAFFLQKSRPKYMNLAQNLEKMSRDTLANLLPPPCVIR
jgi:hypothetical protein